ncbi:MAG TPA: ABC transporter ATP-binding protein [Acidimicrobiales bacterium]|nr:ABC transporter ATP-binding protein [Acidimicrobiales bacterium]
MRPPQFADLVASGLYKAFASQSVLTGLDLSVPAGTMTAVLGPSGSGKTTLLRILAGFERPDRGTVRIGTRVVDDDRHHVAPDKRRIGYVAQEANLFPHLTVEANVCFGLPRRRRSSHRVTELVETLGLEELWRRYPHQLSGGQQQRVAVARALAVKPSIVLLDEPFASLDLSLRGAVRADIQQILRQAGATSVLVTHDQDEALSMADSVAVMRRGVIAQCGTPHELYVQPVDSELAGFVGEANLIAGTASGATVDTALGRLPMVGTVHDSGQPVTVLVRPEQLEIGTGTDDQGVPARVVCTEYYGHDAVIRLTAEPAELPPLTARVVGTLQVNPDQLVHLRVTGAVKAWTGAPASAGPE